ncbi:MAG TPA: leishmanolysin-related zinc metalloendopeptidase [Gemmatimonadales bacterium]|nr:leishmanolysin-related zinc metalloendopeptidase [Gemmatimonadales bacterium]
MTRFTRLGTAFAALALAACVDTQAPDNTPTAPTASKPRLPVMETMQVTAAAANGEAFTITLRFINTPTTAQRAFFETAAAKWQGIIVGDVPDTEGTIPARSCGNSFKTPTFSGLIDDVLIDVLLQPIDGPGAVLGAAGPCLVRNADLLTVYGLMFFDTADLATLAQFGIFDEVVVHEMGHVLGVGTLWNIGTRQLRVGSLADPRFIGPNGVAGYLDVGGRGTSIPVEEDGGPGTRLSHWDEETFDEELMTGFISLQGDSPLSVMTIGSMQDLGYATNPAVADRYQVSGRQERIASDEPAAAQFDIGRREKLIQPLGVIE